jgi:hypothetical protein
MILEEIVLLVEEQELGQRSVAKKFIIVPFLPALKARVLYPVRRHRIQHKSRQLNLFLHRDVKKTQIARVIESVKVELAFLLNKINKILLINWRAANKRLRGHVNRSLPRTVSAPVKHSVRA